MRRPARSPRRLSSRAPAWCSTPAGPLNHRRFNKSPPTISGRPASAPGLLRRRIGRLLPRLSARQAAAIPSPHRNRPRPVLCNGTSTRRQAPTTETVMASLQAPWVSQARLALPRICKGRHCPRLLRSGPLEAILIPTSGRSRVSRRRRRHQPRASPVSMEPCSSMVVPWRRRTRCHKWTTSSVNHPNPRPR